MISGSYIKGGDYQISSTTELKPYDPAFERTGYTFKYWTDDLSQHYSPADIVQFTEDVTNLSAMWEINRYAVTFTQPANGTIGVKLGTVVVDSGDTVPYNSVLTITATPDAGWKLNKVVINGTEYSTSPVQYTVGATAVTIAASMNDDHGIINYYPGY